MEDVLIKIAADAKEFVSGLAEVEESSDTLSDKFRGVGTVAGVAFAGISASIMGAVYAYREQEQASIQVNQTIFSTGGIAGVTADKVNELAEALSTQTTYSRTTVTQTEAMLLTFTQIGKETFPAATEATLDFAQVMGVSATEAARTIGRALQDPIQGTAMLTRYGITLTDVQKAQIKTMVDHGNVAGAQAIVLGVLQARFGGAAKAAAGGTGSFLQVKNALEDLTQAIGEDLAPMLINAAHWLTQVIKSASENKPLVDLISNGLMLAASFTGVVTAVSGAIFAWGKLSSVFELATGAIEAIGAATGIAMSATGVGAILVVGGLIYAYWDKIWPAMKATFQAFVQNISGLAMGLGKMLLGAVSLDLDMLKEGWAQAKLAITQSVHEIGQAVLTETKTNDKAVETENKRSKDAQFAQNRASAQADMDAQKQHNALMAASQAAASRATIMQLQGASAQAIALKKQESEMYKMLADQQYAGSFNIIRQHLAQIQAAEQSAAANEIRLADANRGLEQLKAQNASQSLIKLKEQEIAELQKLSQTSDLQEQKALQLKIANTQKAFAKQYSDEMKARQQFEKNLLKDNQTFQKMSTAEQQEFIREHEQALVTQYQTEEQAQAQYLSTTLQAQIQEHNQALQDEQKFGATYAQLNAVTRDEVFKSTQSSYQTMTAMTQSHNDTLTTIGKQASAAQIIMNTYQAATSVFAGFATIPIVGYALGIAMAAATIAWGMEQLAQVEGMAQGGLVTGGIPGVDSVPIMAQQGELVVPKQNFQDVVDSYANRKTGQGSEPSSSPGQSQQVDVRVGFTSDAARILAVKEVRQKALGISRSGS